MDWVTLALGILKSVADELAELFKWKAAEAQINARKLAYDIDQNEIKKGNELRAKIDAARNAGDLAAVAQLLDDQANAALFTANVRSAIPVLSGQDLGLCGGIPETGASGSGPDAGAKPAPSPEPSQPVIPIPAPAHPVVVIPKVPYSITGLATIFGLNYDGTDDRGDVSASGKDLVGAFGDATHNMVIVGVSLPTKIVLATIGDYRVNDGDNQILRDIKARRYTVDVLSHVTGKHLVSAWLVDVGPAAWTGHAIDLTYASAKLLGHQDNGHVTYWINGPSGNVLIAQGWDFARARVA